MAGMFSKVKGQFGTFGSASDEVANAKKADEEGASLTTVLPTDEDRAALTLLVCDCTEVMRQNILDIFDAKQTGEQYDTVTNMEPVTSDEAILKPEVDPATVDAPAMEKAKKELERREKEVNSTKMQELKKSALTYFDDWRDHVILRIGEVVNSKDRAEEQKDKSHPRTQRPPSAGAKKSAAETQQEKNVEEAMARMYPPVDNPLKKLPREKRALILNSMLLLLLSLEHYHAHSRTLLLHLTSSLDLPPSVLADDESKVARGLLAAAENMQADEETKKKQEEGSDMRKWKVGLATVAGAALIGVTGGLAAPLLAAGLGSVMGGLGLGATAGAAYLGTLAGSSVIVGGLFGAYGGRMTGKMMDQYAREIEDFAFIPVNSYHKPRKIEKEYRRLRVAIGVSGWLTEKEDVVEPWKIIGIGMESFALRFELEALMNIGNSLTSMVTSAAWGFARSEIIKRTVFATLAAGLWPLALLKVGRVIDNPWSVASSRASKAGEVLADALMNKAQGERPVTLIGYSLGARVIYTCLQKLAERKAFGLVETVVLIGAPAPSTSAEWRAMRTVASGRVVNVYSTNDYILAFLYRSSSIQYGVAGLQAIAGVKGVENVDVSDLVSGHTSYRFLNGTVLQRIGFDEIDQQVLESEARALKEEEARQEEARQESEKKEEKKGTPDDKPGAADAPSEISAGKDISEQHVDDLEKEIKQKNEQSYLGWAGSKVSQAGSRAKAQWSSTIPSVGGKPGSPAPEAGATGSPAAAGQDSYKDMKARSDARQAAMYEGT
jgi:pimeloyl-ACP methyl ester carboxylesterase